MRTKTILKSSIRNKIKKPKNVEKSTKILYTLRNYFVAFLISGIFIFLKIILDPILGNDTPFLLLITAVILSSWYGGFEGGFTSSIITTFASYYLFIEPSRPYGNTARIIQVSVFFCEGIFISFLNSWLRKTESSLRERVSYLEEIYKFKDITSRSFNWNELYIHVLRNLKNILKADHVGIILYDDNGTLRFRAWEGLSASYRRSTENYSPWQNNRKRLLPIIISDIQKDNKLKAIKSVILKEGIQALVFVPLFSQHRFLGRFTAYYKTPHALNEEEIKLTKALASDVGFAIDHKKKEEEVKHSKDELEAIFQNVYDGIIVQNNEGKIFYANDAAGKILGLTSSTLLETPVEKLSQKLDVLTEEDTQLSLSVLLGKKDFSPRTKVQDLIIKLRFKPTNKEKIILVRSTSVYNNEKKLELSVSVWRDITQRRKTERIQLFLTEASSILFNSLDYETTLRSVANLAVPRLADWCTVDIVERNKDVRSIAIAHIDPKKLDLVREIEQKYPPNPNSPIGVFQSLQTGKSHFVPIVTDSLLRAAAHNEEHLKILRKLKLKSYMVVPLIARGQKLGAMTFIIDSSDRNYDNDDLAVAEELARRAAIAVENSILYKDATEAIQARDEFLSIASHELKTPVTSILLQLQNILYGIRKGSNEGISPTRLRGLLESAENQSKRLSRLINDLLNVSVAASGRLKLEPEELDLSRLAFDVIKRMTPQLKQAGYPNIQFKSDKKVVGFFDRFRIEQVITNLISNAIKYGEKNSIEIVIKKINTKARFIITDNGIGIEKEQLETIFTRFGRGVSNKDYRGLGIGLYIVDQIVRAHRGKITVKSTLGKGSSFILELPLKKA